ncbi:hypothetical protein ACR77J_07290 [Tissierella praeacuta]|uniref:hypothetical protein n=1 Tax=Tissierella praeacuta TaxID=43131 RepID=UPI003DA5EF39
MKLKNIGKVSFVNTNTGEKVLESNYQPIQNEDSLSYKEPEYVKIPITIDDLDIPQDIITLKSFKLEASGILNGKPIKMTYPDVKTDGKYFYAKKDDNYNRVYIEDSSVN